jgi:hypothetical protein
VLFEGGEHGRLAARLATQVIKAYVDKKARVPNKVADGERNKPGRGDIGQVDIGALWTAPEGDQLQGASFSMALPKKRAVLAAAAPGLVPVN